MIKVHCKLEDAERHYDKLAARFFSVLLSFVLEQFRSIWK